MKNEIQLGKISYLVIDVDGTLTDGGIYYDDQGNEMKKFNTKDAAGFFAAHQVGIEIIVLTGRESLATQRRMTEMKVEYLVQNCTNKSQFLFDFMSERKLSTEEVGVIGDDLNDLAVMKMCGFAGCPADSCDEVKAVADYVSVVKGGHGAVRDIITFLLKKRGEWNTAIERVYGCGV